MPHHLLALRGCVAVPRVLVVLGILAIGAPRSAEAQVVRGTVVAAADRTPVADVRLLLRDADGTTRAAAISSESGAFVLNSDASGMVRLEVKHIGYANWQTANFALASDAEIEVEVKLGIEAIPLEPLTVITRRSVGSGRLAAYERRASAPGRVGGYFLDRGDLERRPAASTTGLVLGAPGMSVRPAGSAGGLDRNVIMSGDCVARTFIDGVRFQQTPMTSVDDLIVPGALEGVEVYPRARSAPLQYQDLTHPECGVAPDGGWGRGRVAVGFGVLLGIVTLGLMG